MESRLETLIAKLRERDCRITPQRLALLEMLIESDEHPSAAQLYERLRTRFPTTSLATVYKTLNLLRDLGEVVEISFSDGDTHYDASNPTPHIHLICTQCHRISDVAFITAPNLARELEAQTGYRITGHRFDFYGICPDCQAKPQI
ncbi:MAG TPA: Fur family transcriptional regulator [Anaerolineae bacterium]|nr:Fur family transcriptional regulator [Anaerolineae bacterium]HQK13880.1 Fur family transcriptional regulator [Anaerolineae bacterium]